MAVKDKHIFAGNDRPKDNYFDEYLIQESCVSNMMQLQDQSSIIKGEFV